MHPGTAQIIRIMPLGHAHLRSPNRASHVSSAGLAPKYFPSRPTPRPKSQGSPSPTPILPHFPSRALPPAPDPAARARCPARRRGPSAPGCGPGPGNALLAAAALARLEAALRAKAGDPDARVADFFDAAAGAGAGGVLVACPSAPQASASSPSAPQASASSPTGCASSPTGCASSRTAPDSQRHEPDGAATSSARGRLPSSAGAPDDQLCHVQRRSHGGQHRSALTGEEGPDCFFEGPDCFFEGLDCF
jgi:hypothetical protein